jgi:exopolyphosphatase/guanosine-5'-triphosphate,3'-diphosphate pyrophosphatase
VVTKAVLDVGSNSVLLVVGDLGEGSLRVHKETSAVTGLGRDTKQTGELSREGMKGTLAAIRQAFATARGAGAEEVLAAATMAARIARNTREFQAAAEAQGTPVYVLSAQAEAELGLAAVCHDPTLSDSGRITVLDPGGHSTEVVTARLRDGAWVAESSQSLTLGTLGLRGGVLSAASPSLADRLRAVVEIDEALSYGSFSKTPGNVSLVGAVGTNLVAIRERMTVWDADAIHGATLTYDEVSRAVGTLMDLDDRGRASLVGIEPGREETIHIGALIVERLLHRLGVESCRVSVRGWRHALLEAWLSGRFVPPDSVEQELSVTSWK